MAFFPSFYGWVIFHCVHIPNLLYPLTSWWTFGLLPCLGYCKQCCYEHRVHVSFQFIEVLLSQGSHSLWLIKGRDFTLFSVILKYLPIVNHGFLVHCQPLAGRRSLGQQQHQDGTCRAEAGSPLAPAPHPAELCLWQLPVKKTRKFTHQIWSQWECPLLCLTPLSAIVQLDSLGWMPQLRESAETTGCISLAFLGCLCDVWCSPISLFNHSCPWLLWTYPLGLAPLISGRQDSGRGLVQGGDKAENGHSCILIFYSGTSPTFGKKSLILCWCPWGCQLPKASWCPPRTWPCSPVHQCQPGALLVGTSQGW